MLNGYRILNGPKYSHECRSQSYLVFEPAFKYFQTPTGTGKFLHKAFQGMSKVTFRTPVTSDNNFPPKLTFVCNEWTGAKYKRNCLV